MNGLLLTLPLSAVTPRQERKPFQRLYLLRGGTSKAKAVKSPEDAPHDLTHSPDSSEVNNLYQLTSGCWLLI